MHARTFDSGQRTREGQTIVAGIGAMAIAVWAVGAPRSDTHPLVAIKLTGPVYPVAPATTQPVPDLAAQGVSEKAIHKLYKADYDATGLADRQALAQKLLHEAFETHDDWTARYVLLRDARDIAVHCGDLSTALKAVDDLAREYGIDGGEMTLQALNTAGRSADSVATLEPVVRTALCRMDAAAEREDYPAATKLGELAEVQAIRAKKASLTTLVQERVKELRGQQQQWEQAKAARATLKNTPADVDARLVAGRFACLVRGDWEMGLPLLIGCSDAALRGVAEREMARPVDPGEQIQLGNDLWDLAEKQGHMMKLHLQGRAAEWYRRALPQLSGIKSDSVTKRLEEAESAAMTQMMLEPGLAAELFSAENFSKRAVTRVDAQIAFDWGTGAPVEGMPKDNFSIRWTGMMNVRNGGRYTILLTANSGARVMIDEKTVVDEANMVRKHLHVPVEFTPGLHTVRVEFWDGGGEANIRLMWLTPGSAKEEAIPASVFWHEGGR